MPRWKNQSVHPVTLRIPYRYRERERFALRYAFDENQALSITYSLTPICTDKLASVQLSISRRVEADLKSLDDGSAAND